MEEEAPTWEVKIEGAKHISASVEVPEGKKKEKKLFQRDIGEVHRSGGVTGGWEGERENEEVFRVESVWARDGQSG